ncbi:MAG TPA: family 10 glycosylhydrolase [Thermoanaerobaculia bacterium]|nr:family 10 glycosylhydrolase [Thermoanaerobaculia bacterium]
MLLSRRAFAVLSSMMLLQCVHVAPPLPAGEFRGLWVATVRNIDWPSKPGLPVEEQKRELVAILDRMVELNLNGMIFHVRPSADALYPSDLEPWSEYLTGEMGKAPEPFYDPLAFAIDEAHRRGIELHAWLNPYRARRLSETAPAASTHITLANPDLVRTYGSFLWMDPGEPVVRERAVAVVRDIVRRYDVDGIHFDDYFYPYPENGADFPDEATWRRHGNGMPRDEWRRKNVDDLIEQVARTIKEEKPGVRFGLSPFGIWRPGHPRSVRGLDSYEQIYADSRKWIRQGWVDYFAPQLYWSSTAPQQKFGDLLGWWSRQNRHGRNMWPGLAAHRVGNGRPNSFNASEITGQIRHIRRTRQANGWILFNAKVVMQNRGGIADALKELNRNAPPRPR